MMFRPLLVALMSLSTAPSPEPAPTNGPDASIGSEVMEFTLADVEAGADEAWAFTLKGVGSSVDDVNSEHLELGQLATARFLLSRAPERRWIAAVEGTPEDTLLWPVPGGKFGRGVGHVRRHELRHIRHDGVDIVAPMGTPVRAVNDGVVAYNGDGVTGYGNFVGIVHADGTVSFYAHLNDVDVTPGQQVARGETIGTVGMTGLARGPHLHFEWHVEGPAVDPSPRFADVPPNSRRPRGHA